MATLESTPEMVSYVRTAMALPIMFFAIPAGVLADRVDRRKLLLFTQVAMLATTTVLSALTFSSSITSWGLLALTFLIGVAATLHIPTWQATIPELVPRSEMPRAIALGSMSFNLARAVGPVAGGFLIAKLNTWSAFALNACSFLGVILILIFWRRPQRESSRGLSFSMSMYQGVRYTIRKPRLRNVMVGVTLFIVPASCFWALLPLVAKQRLGWGADGLGFLVASFGVGAVLAAQVLPYFQSRFGMDRTIAGAMLTASIGILGMSQSSTGWINLVSTVVLGGSWMITLTTLNSAAQMQLPNRMRARGMSCYLTMIAISMAPGSALWGKLAGWSSIPTAQTIAAATLMVTAAISLTQRVE